MASTIQQDWSRLLTDPDLVKHIGELLHAYRDAAPDQREQALLEAMRKVKNEARHETEKEAARASAPVLSPAAKDGHPFVERRTASASAPGQPPFQPDIFTPSPGQDRRRYPRLKCFIAVELRGEGSPEPIWGNLSNASAGGCYIETLSPVNDGTKLEIGLWANNGKVWVKGIVLSGVVVQSSPSFGVRVKYTDMDPQQRDTLRFFLKFVESTTKNYQKENGYVARLKR